MRLLLVLALLLSLALAACNGDGSSPAASATPGVTASASPSPPIDGTIDPLGAGSTNPVTVKPNPDPPVQAITLTDVRIGLHPEQGGWDRIVFEFDRDLPAGEISYVDKSQVVSCGPGEVVPIQGQAVLSVRLLAQAHNDAGMSTIDPRDFPGQGGVITEVKMYCDFEGHVNYAIGLKARQPFKVTTLTNPRRLVIDIKQ